MRIRPADAIAQSSRVSCTISMMVRTPRPSSPTRQAKAPCELDLRGSVGAVAELVLEALQAERIDLPVRPKSRHQETGQPARRLRQHQERVAHRRRHEPFVAGDAIAFAGRHRRAVVLARTSVPPCFSVMPMPMVTPDFSFQQRKLGSYYARQDLRHHARQQRRRAAASAATAARVIVTGHMCPFSTCATM